MLSIDEAIARERKLAENYRNDIAPKEDYHNMPWIDMANEGNKKAADEHEQLAKWLEELKDYRDKNKMIVRIDIENIDSIKDKIEELSKYAESQYNKALDDFVHKVKEHHYVLFDVVTNGTDYGMFTFGIEQIAEELKEQND